MGKEISKEDLNGKTDAEILGLDPDKMKDDAKEVYNIKKREAEEAKNPAAAADNSAAANSATATTVEDPPQA